jgi:site-specific recombinase XerD
MPLLMAERLKSRQTVRQVFTSWSELELIKRRDGGPETTRGIEKDVMRKIGKRYAGEIICTVVMNVLDTVKARGASRLANRLLTKLRQMFRFALVREIVTTDPTAGIEKNMCAGKRKNATACCPRSSSSRCRRNSKQRNCSTPASTASG